MLHRMISKSGRAVSPRPPQHETKALADKTVGVSLCRVGITYKSFSTERDWFYGGTRR